MSAAILDVRRAWALVASVAVASAVVVASAGCGDDEHVDPVGLGGGSADGASSAAVTTAGSGASGETATSSSTGQGGGGGGGAPIRTIIQRDPFGNVAETRNLLWDGDFEWESAFADQYGWLQGFSGALADRRVGPECRSGLKCGVLGADLVGIAVSSTAHDLYASVWVKPFGPSCSEITSYLIAQGIYDDGGDLPLSPVAAEIDASGWCHFEATVAQRDDKSYLYVSHSGVGVALVDDAVVREATAEESRRVLRHGAFVPTADVAAKLTLARENIRRWRGPHDGPDARRALERWRRDPARKVIRPNAVRRAGDPR